MINKFKTVRQFASMTAILAALLFAVGPASAGTQRPAWKDRTPSTPPPSQGAEDGGNADNGINPVNGDDGYDGYEGEGTGDDGGTQGGQMTDDGDDGGTNAIVAPTPSAVAGGLAMLGLMAGRRRRQA